MSHSSLQEHNVTLHHCKNIMLHFIIAGRALRVPVAAVCAAQHAHGAAHHAALLAEESGNLGGGVTCDV
jgi:hypothetical protein